VEVLKCMMLSGAIAGTCPQHRGNNREVFATSFRYGTSSVSRADQHLFTDLRRCRAVRWIRMRSTMLPASRAAECRCSCNATSACASAGASFVPSPVIGNQVTSNCSGGYVLVFVPASLRHEIVDACSAAIAAAVADYRQ